MIIDIVVGLVILASALISFMRGFIREALTIAGVVGGIVAAILFGPHLAPTVRVWFGATDGSDKKFFDMIPMENVADVTTYGVIFIAVVIVIAVFSHFMSGAAKAVGLGPVDRTLGMIFGVARAFLLLALVYLPFHVFMKPEDKENIFKDSRAIFLIEKISSYMATFLPNSDEVQDKASDEFKKRLEDQDLLGIGKKDKDQKDDGKGAPHDSPKDPLAPAQPEQPSSGTGYDDKARNTFDKLFNEPVANQ